MLFSEGLEGFAMHPSSFDFFQCDLNNLLSSGGVESFRVFSQSFDCYLHCHNTMSPPRLLSNFKYRHFFPNLCLYLFSSVPLMVDLDIGVVVVVGGCD